jgi:integrase
MEPIMRTRGISTDKDGPRGRFKLAGVTHRRRFPVGTSDDTIARWILDERARLTNARGADYGDPELRPHHRPRAAASTLDDDAHRFLQTIAGRRSAAADGSHLRAWLPVEVAVAGKPIRIGALSRGALTLELVKLVIAQWRAKPAARAIRRVRVGAHTRDGRELPAYERAAPATSGRVISARTIHHRVRVLRELYRTLDERRGTMFDELVLPAKPKSHPVGVDAALIFAVARRLAAASVPRKLVKRYRTFALKAAADAREVERAADYAKTYARYLVLVTTGQRPVQVMRAEPGDLKLTRRTWIVREAKHEPAHVVQLTAEMVSAWERFIDADAWGDYDTSQHANRLHAAGWPDGLRPYTARHSLMIDALDRGIDLGDVQGLAGHTSPVTTRTFYGPITAGRQRSVADRLEGRLSELFKPYAVK